MGDVVGRRRDSSRLAPIMSGPLVAGWKSMKTRHMRGNPRGAGLPSNSTTRVRLSGKSFEEGARIVHDGQPATPMRLLLARVDRGTSNEQAGHRLAGAGAFFD